MPLVKWPRAWAQSITSEITVARMLQCVHTVVSCERQNVVRRRCERTSYKFRHVCSTTQGRSYLELYTRPRPIPLARGPNIIYLGCSEFV